MGESTCEDSEEEFSAWILLRLMCKVSAKVKVSHHCQKQSISRYVQELNLKSILVSYVNKSKVATNSRKLRLHLSPFLGTPVFLDSVSFPIEFDYWYLRHEGFPSPK